MIQTILVAIDGSEHARKAVMLASDIAEKYDARLILLHVLTDDPIPPGLRRMAETEHLIEPRAESGPFAANIPAGSADALHRAGDGDSSAVLAQRLGEWISEAAEKIAKEKGVIQVSSTIGSGDPAEQILSYAKKEDANLIVMGSRGLSDLKGLLVGSVSHKVSQLSECTCVSVK